MSRNSPNEIRYRHLLANQEATIDQLRAENANLARRLRNAERGRRQLLAMIDRPEPPRADEWHDMVAQAWAEMEADSEL